MTAHLGPNDTQPCGSDARRRTHWARGEICVVCEPDVEWRHPCPVCRDRVAVVGVRVQPHTVEDDPPIGCPGAGMTVPAPRTLQPARMRGAA